MKNNKILYLLTILIALFSFNTNVNADNAKELTCVYEWNPDKKERVVVVQESDGSRSMFVTSELVEDGNYGLDSLKYGAWKENTYQILSYDSNWDSCKKGYSVFSPGVRSFGDTEKEISLEASYSSALSPLIGTEMFITKDQLKSIAEKYGYDNDYDDGTGYYFDIAATTYCIPQNQNGPKCFFLVGNLNEVGEEAVDHCENIIEDNIEKKICEVLFNNEQYKDLKGLYGLYAMRPQADNLSKLAEVGQDFKKWLSESFCGANSDNKLCKMVFDYNYTRDDGSVAIGDNLDMSCYFVHKYAKDIILGGNKELRFRFHFWGDENFGVSYAPPSYITETNPGNIFSPYNVQTGDFTYHKDNIHLYPRNSSLQEFGIEYIKKYKDQGDCPEITFCADNASDGGNINWYLELGSAEEIAATGKYTIGMCYDYNEETGEIEDVYINNELTYNLLGGIITIEKCEDLFTGDEDSVKLLEIIKTLFTLSRISIPLIIIVLGSIDFVKCIFSGNEDGMKKAQNKFMKRLLLGVVIFLVPTLLKFVLEIANEIWPNISSDFCGIL